MMKLPNGDNAIVEAKKLLDYCLNSDHPRGGGKARVFLAVLGLKRGDAEILREALLIAARDGDAKAGELDEYGQRYTIDFEMTTGSGTGTIRSGWIVLVNETIPRLTTCYVMRPKKRRQDGNE